MVASIAAVDAVIAIGVYSHLKRHIALHQLLGEIHCILEVYVVVRTTMDNEQIALQAIRQSKRRSLAIAFGILLRGA